MTTNERFVLTYDGPALQNHEMDVRNLAPALIGLADLFEEANRIISPQSAKVTVNVKGTFKSGSFEIDLNLIHDIQSQILNFLQSPFATNAALLLNLIGISPIKDIPGLIQLIKATLHGKITKVETVDDQYVSIQISYEEGFQGENKKLEISSLTKTLKVDKRVLSLFKHEEIRSSVARFIYDPLSMDGIDEVKITSPKNNKSVVIHKAEKEAFSPINLETEELKDTITEEFLQLVSISFREENKWRFSRGAETFYAKVTDDEFLSGIEKNEISFSKGDILLVKLRTKQSINDNKELTSQYEVIEVLEHRKAYLQLKLPD